MHSRMQDLFPELGSLSAEELSSIAVTGKPVFLIAITARSGSTWLCREFEALCNVGTVTEVMNPRGPIQHSGCWRAGIPFAEYFGCLVDKLSGEVFAFKTSWHDFAPIAPHAQILFPQLRVAFVKRGNIEAQALSQYLARRTGQWHLHRDEQREPKRPPKLDLSMIDWIIDQTEREIANWARFLADSRLSAREIYYEDFREDIESGVCSLAEAAGVAMRRRGAEPPPLQKLGDDNDPWLLEIARHRQAIRR